MNLGAQLVFLKLWLLSILTMYVGATRVSGPGCTWIYI